MGYFPKGFKGPAFDAFMSAAQALREEYAIGHVQDAAVIPEGALLSLRLASHRIANSASAGSAVS